MPEPVVDVRDLTRRFGEFTAVDRISFAVERGEVDGFIASAIKPNRPHPAAGD